LLGSELRLRVTQPLSSLYLRACEVPQLWTSSLTPGRFLLRASEPLHLVLLRFIPFMANLTNKKFTATQYALLSSLMGVPRTVLSAPTGYMAEYLSYEWFFLFCALIALPGLYLIKKFSIKEDE